MDLIAGRFVIQNHLNEGAMGVIYLGIDQKTNETVAIKSLKPHLLVNNPIHLERFVREGELLRKLDHPNIVKMLATDERDGQRYIVMEYLPHGSLAELLRNEGPLKVDQTLAIALELADALTRAHHLNIIHRDLKPENVLIADDGTPRLSDFGLARFKRSVDLTDENLIVGTLPYLSPEALNNHELDQRTDIWAFGVMLYEMLSGIRPFRGDSIGAISNAILSKPPDPDLETLRPEVPIELIDLIYRMLEKDPRVRISSTRLIGAQLEAIQYGALSPNMRPRIDDVDDTSIMSRDSRFIRTPPDGHKANHNLPAQTTLFLGRDVELSELQSLLNDPAIRLVSIVGAGGMGKTRLGLALAESQLDHCAEGVYFVPLAPINDPQTIVSAIAEIVGLQFFGDLQPQQQLQDYLRMKHMLLLMDNFEHVIEGADIVSHLLQAAPNLKVVVTSRERLGLHGETVFNVVGMDVPYTSTELFVQSARYVDPRFALDERSEPIVIRICKLVDGMPLGIVLAAAWIDQLSLDEIADEIERGFDFLETTMRDIPARHKSIRSAIQYSWNLLSEDEQAVFAKTSVFRGGFTREAAQSVSRAPLRTLTTLVHKSLLVRDRDTGRYDIHELLRQFAAEALGKMPEVEAETHQRHAVFFADFVETRQKVLSKGIESNAYDEIDNFRVMWLYAVDVRDIAILERTARGMNAIYHHRNDFFDGSSLFQKAIDCIGEYPQNEEEQRALGILHLFLGNLLMSAKEPETTRSVIKRGFELIANIPLDPILAYAQITAVVTLMNIGSTPKLHQRLESLARQSLNFFEKTDDGASRAYCTLALAALVSRRDNDHALQLVEEGLGLAISANDQNTVGWAYQSLGRHASNNGDFQQSCVYYEKAVATHEAIGLYFYIPSNYAYASIAAGLQKDAQSVRRYRILALDWADNIGINSMKPYILRHVGYAALFAGLYDLAEQDFSQYFQLTENSDHDSNTFARSLFAELELARNNIPAAQSHLQFALTSITSTTPTTLKIACISPSVQLMTITGKTSRAIELVSLVLNSPAADVATRYTCQLHADKLKTELPTSDFDAAWQRGQSFDIDTIIQELLTELDSNE